MSVTWPIALHTYCLNMFFRIFRLLWMLLQFDIIRHSSPDIKRSFLLQKRIVRTNCKWRRFLSHNKLVFKNSGILTLLFIQESAALIKQKPSNFKINSEIHNYKNRQCGNLHLPRSKLTLVVNSPDFLSVKICNKLAYLKTLKSI